MKVQVKAFRETLVQVEAKLEKGDLSGAASSLEEVRNGLDRAIKGLK
jgi:hypothetical protein